MQRRIAFWSSASLSVSCFTAPSLSVSCSESVKAGTVSSRPAERKVSVRDRIESGRARLTLSDGSRSDLSKLDEHEVAQLLDVVVVAETGKDTAEVLVDFDLLEASVEQGMHALIGGLPV